MKRSGSYLITSIIGLSLLSCGPPQGTAISPKDAAAEIDVIIEDKDFYIEMKRYLPESAAAYREALIDVYATAKSKAEVRKRVFDANANVRRENAKFMKTAPDEELVAYLMYRKAVLDAFGANIFACNAFLTAAPDDETSFKPDNRKIERNPEIRALGMGKYHPVQRDPHSKADVQAFREFFHANGGTHEQLALVGNRNSLDTGLCEAMKQFYEKTALFDAPGADRWRAYIAFTFARL